MNLPLSKDPLIPGSGASPLVDLSRHEVSARVVTDPAIYKLELEQLWKKSWLLLGHDSEIANPGDYMTRYMGEDMVVVNRDRDGNINVLLNSCPHRGMPVCRADMGRANTFICPYHGWTFAHDGELKVMPVGNQKMEGDLLTKAELGLKRARVDTHCGLIFATFDANAPSLLEWLGDAAWYLTLAYGRTEHGMEVLGPPQRWVIECNWKFAAEQFVGGDAYHILTNHRSIFEMGGVVGESGDISPDDAPGTLGIRVSLPQGHSFFCAPLDFSPVFGEERAATMTTHEKLLALPPAGMTPELVERMFARFDDNQLRLLADAPPTVGGLFPNIGTHNFLFPHPDDAMLGAAHGLHAFIPRGPNKMEWWNWQLVEKDAPQELKDRIAETGIMVTGPTGMLEADDAEMWPFMQRAAEGVVASEGVTGTIKYQALIGENRPADWPGPAGRIVSDGFAKDDGQWAFWLRYRDFMEGETW